MRRPLIVLFLLALLATSLYAREWLVGKGIISLEDQLKAQLAQQVQTAPTLERVHYLSQSAVVYERFLEPVILEANRLIWPFTREHMMSEWKRSVHTKLEDLTQAKALNFTAELDAQLKGIRQASEPGVTRLYKVLEEFDNLASGTTCKTTVQDEMKALGEFTASHDEKILSALKEEGMARLKHLKQELRKMSTHQIGLFLGNGKFIREIEEPVISLILKIKKEDLRNTTWNEFEKKLTNVLSRKNIALAKAQTEREKQFEKLFKPLAEAFVEPSQVHTQAPSSLMPPTESDVASSSTAQQDLPYDSQ